MANKTIVKKTTAAVSGTTTIYTHTEDAPVLLKTLSLFVDIPSSAVTGINFQTNLELNFVKKQPDGSYVDVVIINPIQVRRVDTPGDSDNAPTHSLYVSASPNSAGPYNNMVFQRDKEAADLPIAEGATQLLADASFILAKDDYFTVKVSGLTFASLSITWAITGVILPITKTYKTANFCGFWISGASYQKNQTVLYNNDLYIAIQQNADVSLSSTNWHIIKKNALPFRVTSLSELVTPSGTVGATISEPLTVASTLSNKNFVAAKINGNFFVNSASYSLPAITSNQELVLTTGAQTIENKTFLSPSAINSTTAVNFSNFTHDFTRSGASVDLPIDMNGVFLFTPVAKTLTAGSNNIVLTDSMNISCQTTTTTADSFTLVLPTPANYVGVCVSLIIKMRAANQTVAFSGNFKTPRTITASTTANLTDRYFLISDGTAWYCTQLLKGIA
jgi:hypothetical protein